MDGDVALDVRVRPELNDRLSALATALGRPPSWVVQQALEEYVALQDSQLAAIAEGMRAAEDGRVVPHADVAAWVSSWDRANELPMPKRG